MRGDSSKNLSRRMREQHYCMYSVYILRSKLTGIHYTGYTSDIEERMKYHNSGKTASLRKHRPLEIIRVEAYNSLQEARNRERQIKSYKSGEAFRKLLT